MSSLDFPTLSSWVHRILGAYSATQLVSIATILVVTYYTFATEYEDRARKVRRVGLLAMLPFGYMATFLYFLLLVFFDKDAEGVTSPRSSSPVQHHQEIDIPLPGGSGWSVNVKFNLSSSPHVSVTGYNFTVDMLDKNLNQYIRSGNVTFKYEIAPSDFIQGGNDAVLEPLHVQLEIVHRRPQSVAIYKLSLVKWNLALSSGQIPFEFRKGGAGGQGWKIDGPVSMPFIKPCFLDPRIKHLLDESDVSKFHADITQVTIPIITPILKSLTFVGNPPHGGDEEFFLAHLTHLELDRISVFPEEFLGILDRCEALSSRGSGTSELIPPRRIVSRKLHILRFLRCRTPIHGFFSSTHVHLAVAELSLQTDVPQNTLQVHHLGLQWETILRMELSERWGDSFIRQCRRNLSADTTLEIISN
ncbi:hypothetical protein BDP27DRAFT_1320460 [Rhodocollybia butyracea]|uniref:Uncharacterized protein n=1 Tax=Rhodocollybia butyracea TaxID=206335 RepID=A0A9P5UAW3_9AGAR|nr:hypothetical protein BDP27DRAFT_1320460 [Rhodocollybia butyracea]